jgi:MFS family permease
MYGRKRVFLAGAAIFLLGSILCGLAHGMLALVAFRTLQGIGAGGVQPVATTIVGDLFTPVERARVQGYLSATWGIAGILGPVLGAFLVEHVSWSAVFWINVPIVIACMIVMVVFFHERAVPHGHRIDYPGALLLALGIGALIVALVMSASLPLVVIGALALAATGALAALVVHERRAAEPILPPALYRNRIVVIGSSGNFTIGMLVMAAAAFLPPYLQGVMHGKAVLSGIVLGALSVAWSCGSVGGGGLMTRTSYRFSASVGGVLLIAGSVMLILLDPQRGAVWATCGAALLGLGFGFSNSSFLVSTQSSVGWEARGSATAANLFMRQVGQAVGTAVFGAVFNLGVFGRAPGSVDDVSRLSEAMAGALHDIYLIAGILAVAILALALALPAGLSAARSPG